MPPVRIRIVIADDHPVFRRGLRQAIEDQPGQWLVKEAEDGVQAVELCTSHAVDVAILDINMPKLDGLAALRLLRQRKLSVKVILLTIYDDKALLDEGMALGAQAYLLKDDAIADVLHALRLVLDGEQYLSPSLLTRHICGKQAAQAFTVPKPNSDLLTVTEKKILRLIADDLTSKQIAERLQCSIHTVNAHRQNLSTKLRLSGSHSLLKFAYDHREQL